MDGEDVLCVTVYQLSLPDRVPEAVCHLWSCLDEQVVRMQFRGIAFRIREERIGSRVIFLCDDSGGGEAESREVRHGIGLAVAQYIRSYHEPHLVRDAVRKAFPFQPSGSDAAEKAVLSWIGKKRRRKPSLGLDWKIAGQVSGFLKESRRLAVDGFIRFRLKGYHRVFSRLLEQAVREYRLEQEYREFIELLRYFVSTQKTRIPVIHVLHFGKSRFHLMKGDGTPLRLKDVEGAVQELGEHPFSREDMIVSALLSAAPEFVVLHTRQREETIIRTVRKIFEGRIVLCEGCPLCREGASRETLD
jgi:putative sporulation protein YtxC